MKKYVFVFGSNKEGFHGAGGASFAFSGSYVNKWRECPLCQEAINGGEKKGLMAEWGVSRGYQEGRISTLGSYAIQTVVKPGAKRSVPLKEIRRQVEEELVPFMKEHPDWEFTTSRFAAGYGGYTLPEMAPIWEMITSQPNGKIAPHR